MARLISDEVVQMKTVHIEFAGPKSKKIAKRFYAYLVDGGLEDQLIEKLSDEGVTLEISDCSNDDLAVLFQCREIAAPAKSAKKPGTRKKAAK